MTFDNELAWNAYYAESTASVLECLQEIPIFVTPQKVPVAREAEIPNDVGGDVTNPLGHILRRTPVMGVTRVIQIHAQSFHIADYVLLQHVDGRGSEGLREYASPDSMLASVKHREHILHIKGKAKHKVPVRFPHIRFGPVDGLHSAVGAYR